MNTIAVGIDVSAVPLDPRGAGRYVVELVRHLAHRGVVEPRLLARRGDSERWRELFPAPREATVSAVVPGPRPVRLLWEQLRGPGVVDRWGIAAFHGPHYTMPERARTPAVVTVHDVTYFTNPELHERSKVWLFRRAIRHAASRAATIVCVSEATRRAMEEHVDVSVPVKVIPHGVDHGRFRPRQPGDDDEAVLVHFGIDPAAPYFLFVGTMEPRKDVPTLIRAFARVSRSRPEVQLVLAGGRGWGDTGIDPALDALDPDCRRRVHRTGYVEDAAVPPLLRGAAACVYPAVVEGFGLPVIESMACGTPVATTAGSVMDELAAGAAETFAAGNDEQLAAVLERVLSGEGDSGGRARRLAVAAGFDWNVAAEAHEAVYATIAAL